MRPKSKLLLLCAALLLTVTSHAQISDTIQWPTASCNNSLTSYLEQCFYEIEPDPESNTNGLNTPVYVKLTPANSKVPAGGIAAMTEQDVYQALEKVIVVLDGYDMAESLGEEIPGVPVYTDPFHNLTAENFELEDFLQQDTSILFVRSDLHRNGDNILDNVKAFTELLYYLDLSRDNDVPVTVVGYSLGGVVAKYAISRAELIGLDTNVNLLISYDAPHRGANVPTSLQNLIPLVQLYADQATAMVMEADEKLATHGINADLAELEAQAETLSNQFNDYVNKFAGNTINTVVGDQLKIDDVSNAGLHQPFIDDYHQYQLPPYIRSVAVTNGSVNGSAQEQVAPLADGEYFNFKAVVGNADNQAFFSFKMFPSVADMLSVSGVVGGKATYVYSGNCLESSNPLDVAAGLLIEFLNSIIRALPSWMRPGLIPNVCQSTAQGNASVARAFTNDATINELDYAPGSYIPLAGYMRQIAGEVRDQNLFYSVDFNASEYHEMTFIPTASALDVETPDYNAPIMLSQAPFNAVYVAADYEAGENLDHRRISMYPLFQEIDSALHSDDERVVAMVNHPATNVDFLTSVVGLSSSPANNIIARKAGNDGVLNTADDYAFPTLASIDAVSDVNVIALVQLRNYAPLWFPIDSPLDAKVINYLNTAATAVDLDMVIGLETTLAYDIIESRNGMDAVLGTADDKLFINMASFVLGSNITNADVNKLRDYVQLNF